MSKPFDATVVGRLTGDRATVQKIADAFAEWSDEAAVSAFEAPDKRWTLALYFGAPPDQAAVRARIAAVAGQEPAQALRFETLAPTDWVRISLAGLKPVEAGRFVVHGAHDRARIRPNRIAIEIEAGLAFGTGHHGSTRGCLLALDGLAKRPPGKGRRRVLDIGTGTGVLAIAAAKALRAAVTASDIDARSASIARENARFNRVGALVTVLRADGLAAAALRAKAPYAIVLANILLEPLRRMATPIASLVAPNGRVVLSGLLAAQALPALAAYRARGLVIERRIPLEGWMTLVLRRPALTSRRSSRGRARA
jgi:ribosomal protein L11 methyltransferase